MTFAPGNVPTDYELPNFDAANDMALAPAAPFTSMEAFTNLPAEQNYAYPVSMQQFERRH